MADITTNTLKIGDNNLILRDADAQAKLTTNTQNITQLQTDTNQLKEDITSILDSAYVTDTASGSIASFPDGADGVPVKSLTVNVEPVQDLHGQESPYPAGGGKNLLPMTLANMKAIQSTNGSWNGNTFTLHGVSYTINVDDGDNVVSVTVNGTASQYSLFRLVNEWTSAEKTLLSGTAQGSSGSSYRIQAEGDVTRQDLGNGVILPSGYTATRIIIVVPQGISVSNAVFKPMIRLSSVSDATFAPYSNICPISGYTSAVVTRTGKNLLKTPKSGSSNGITCTTNDDGSVTIEGTATSTAVNMCFAGGYNTSNKVLRVYAGETVTITDAIIFYHYDGQDLMSFGNSNSLDSTGSAVFTFNENGWIDGIRCPKATPQTTYSKTIYPQLELGSTATAYESPNIQTVTIDLGDTIYSGTLDVGTGVLTVDRAMVNASDLTFSQSSSANTRYVAPLSVRSAGSGTSVICSHVKSATGFPSRTGIFMNSPSQVVVVIDGVTSLSDFNSIMSDAKIVYEIETPQTVTLTAEEVTTLLGQNNIWSDAGDVEVKYRADTKLYIEKLTAPTEDDLIADHAISANSFFMIGNTLYRATTAIASGATITVGTNATKLSLSDALNALA